MEQLFGKVLKIRNVLRRFAHWWTHCLCVRHWRLALTPVCMKDFADFQRRMVGIARL